MSVWNIFIFLVYLNILIFPILFPAIAIALIGNVT